MSAETGAAAPTARRWPAQVANGIRDSLSDMRVPIGIYAVHLGIAFVAETAFGPPQRPVATLHLGFTWMLLKSAVLWLAVLAVVRVQHHVAARKGWAAIFSPLGAPHGVSFATTGAVLSSAYLAHHSLLHARWKRMLGDYRAYEWDGVLHSADQLLHFGQAPWVLLHSILAVPSLTSAIDTAYWIWFPLTLGFCGWLAWLPDRPLRRRAFASWALIWVLLGTVVAHLIASGGPAFYAELVAGADPYAALKLHLGQVHTEYGLTAVNLQQRILHNMARGNVDATLSMSAMPSLHVALPLLFALVLHQRHRLLGILMSAYTVLIAVGAVYLGWHYAIDVYASIIGVLAIWAACGALERRGVLGESSHGSAVDR